MRNFASGLGVRCDHCHVGGNPDTLEGFDFASDAKEAKQVARAIELEPDNNWYTETLSSLRQP